MVLYRVVRPRDTVDVMIMKHKDTGRYSFINLTRGHICPCQFDSIDDAVSDLERYRNEGKVIEYFPIGQDDLARFL